MFRSLFGVFAALVAAAAGCTDTRTEPLDVPVPDRTAPLLLLASPSDGANAVPLNARVSATFTEAMDRATLAGAIGVVGPRGAVIGAAAVSDDTRSVTFTPAEPLEPNAVHTASLAAGARDLAGNLLAPTRWAFVTGGAADREPPHVVSVSPARGSLASVALASTVSATFDEPIDCGALPAAALAVSELGVPLGGYLTCAAATLSFVSFPVAPGNTTLRAVLSPLVSDLAGNALGAGDSWSFDVLPWTRLIGTAAQEAATGIAIDAAGHLAVAGFGAVALAGEPPDPNQALVIKLTPGGETEWIHQLGSTGSDLAFAVAFDREGNVLVAGMVSSGIGTTATAGGSDALVAKLDPGGRLLWARLIGSAAPDQVSAIAVDRAGNVLVAGSTDGVLDGAASAGGSDAFLASLAPDGGLRWIRQLGTSQDDYGRGVATGAAGDVVLAGHTHGALPGAVSAGRADLFVARYDPDGVPSSARQLGTIYDDALNALATDEAGNVFLAGGTWAALGTSLTVASAGAAGGVRPLAVVQPGQEDAFVAKLGASLATEWVRQLGSTATTDLAVALAVDGAGGVLVAGQRFIGSGGTGSGFVAKLDFLGGLRWLDRVDGAFLSAGGLAVDAVGNGYLAAPALAGIDGVPPHGGADIAVLRYDPAGRRR